MPCQPELPDEIDENDGHLFTPQEHAMMDLADALGIDFETQEGNEWLKQKLAAKPGDFLGWVDCSCGRRHEVVMGKGGFPTMDTGWY